MEENKNETPMKKSNKGLVVALAIIIIIAIIGGVGYYFLRPTSPKDVFIGGINSTFNNSMYNVNEDVKKINTTITLSGNIDSNIEEIKSIAKYINDGKVSYNVQFDKDLKKALISANIDYQNENLLSGKIYYSNGDENVYVYVQDLFDKYFKVSLKDVIEDEEELATLKSMLNGESATQSGKIDYKKASNIIKDAMINNLKDEYFSKEKVDGVTKNTMKLTASELKQYIKSIATSLKENQDFINCFENKDEVKNGLEELVEEADKTNNSEDNFKVEISLYTKGFKNELEKLEAKVDVADNKQIVLSIVETEEGKFVIDSDIPEVGKVKLNMEVKNDTNTDIENVDVSNSIEINNITQEDQIKLFSNLMNMKLYKYLAPLMQSSAQNSMNY